MADFKGGGGEGLPMPSELRALSATAFNKSQSAAGGKCMGFEEGINKFVTQLFVYEAPSLCEEHMNLNHLWS